MAIEKKCWNCVFWTAGKDPAMGICGCPESPTNTYLEIDGLCPPLASYDCWCEEFKPKHALDMEVWNASEDLIEIGVEMECIGVHKGADTAHLVNWDGSPIQTFFSMEWLNELAINLPSYVQVEVDGTLVGYSYKRDIGIAKISGRVMTDLYYMPSATAAAKYLMELYPPPKYWILTHYHK